MSKTNSANGLKILISFGKVKRVSIYVSFLLVLVCAGLSSCDKPRSINHLLWVEGEWKGRVKGGMMFETWKLSRDSTIIGHSCILANKDTVFQESMRIVKVDGEIYFVATVDHNADPVSFKLVKQDDHGHVFENLEHDFPNRIIYANTLGDMLLARIEGVRENAPDTVRFFMHRNIRFERPL